MPATPISLAMPTILLAIYSFFFNDTATTEIYTLSLHDALPISSADKLDDIKASGDLVIGVAEASPPFSFREDRKSTRLNSSHANISYAVFCLKKKKTQKKTKRSVIYMQK